MYIEGMNTSTEFTNIEAKSQMLSSAFPRIKKDTIQNLALTTLEWEVLGSIAYILVFTVNGLTNTVIMTTLHGCCDYIDRHQDINLVDIVHRGSSVDFRIVKKLEF